MRARAVRITAPGGVEALEIGEIEVREPGPGEVLVEVAAAGLNRADCLQRRGLYPAPPGAPPDVPGLEFSGRVAAVGEGGSLVAPGDRVMGIAGGGAMATHLVAHERTLVPVPAGLSLEDAAAVPEVFFTAYDALFAQGELALGEIALLHSVGSGVGTAALQLCRVAGARVLGTSRTASKLERCAELGLAARDAILVEEGRFAERVKQATSGAGADVVLDTVGAAYLGENAAAAAERGRIVVVGLLGGVAGEAPLGLMLRRRLTLRGTVLRSRPLEEKAHLSREFARNLVPLFDAGALRPVIDDVLPMESIRDAHARMERNETFGKVVLVW
jgi:NADPH:quinone reductase